MPMDPLLLHAGGWDEFGLMAAAIVLAILVIRFTSRGRGDDAEETDPATGDREEAGNER